LTTCVVPDPGHPLPVERVIGVSAGRRLCFSDGVGPLDDRYVKIHHDRILAAANQHAGQFLTRRGIDLLVRDVRRDEDEVAGPCLGGELERLAPAHPGPAAHDVDDALEVAVVMGPRLGVRLDGDRAGPELGGAGGRLRDRGGPTHPGRLRRVRVEVAAGDHPDPVVLPARFLGHAAAFAVGVTDPGGRF